MLKIVRRRRTKFQYLNNMKTLLAYRKYGEPITIMVDDNDYEKVKSYQWIWRDGYACTVVGKRYYQMHRMLMGAQFHDPVIIDHIDGNHCNNQRKSNLRRATRAQNQQNRKTNIGNSLPKGIRKLPNGKYNVRIQTENHRIVFGAFDTLEEALDARNKKAQELHGEFFRASHLI